MRQRVVTALVLMPGVLAVILFGSPYPTIFVGAILTLIGSAELQSLAPDGKRIPVAGILGYALAVVAMLVRPRETSGLACLLFVLGFFGVLAARRMALREQAPTAWSANAASLWIGMPLAACILLQSWAPSPGIWNTGNLALLALLPVWAGDTAAIFVGRYFGKHPFAPQVSPNKTWEGAIANVVAALGVAAMLASTCRVELWLAMACGLAAGVLGQCGDLFESFLKRKANKKDSGDLLPGHGGVLDRIDSVLFTAPVVALLLAAFR